MDEGKQATPHKELIEQLMDSRVPKTEREHAARREIEMLREALRLPAALDAPEPEPVGWFGYSPAHDAWFHTNEGEDDSIPLYRRPSPAAQWVGLTDEEILAEIPVTTSRPATSFARAIEAKLKEKNGG